MKKKSLIVALVSSFIISAVLVLTLVGYLIYVEIKSNEYRMSYELLLERANARIYAKYIGIPKLDARMEVLGALKGKPVIEGVVKNKGSRQITDILMSVKFLDKEGACIYEVVFHPQEIPLGSQGIVQIAIPYFSSPPKVMLKPGDELPFKKILSDCPGEIVSELRKDRAFAGSSDRWSGRFSFEILAIDFSR